MSDHLINTYLGPYQLIEPIGHGGMATVYKAYQPSLDRYVAVKVLPDKGNPEFALRFRREARTIARLQHPNILPVYEHGEQDGHLYLVLQYVENGATLNDLLGQPMALPEVLRLTDHLLNALDYAHRRGVIHRDVKPSNILLTTSGWPMLADFGIAKLIDENQQFTQSGLIVGTAAYIAPEQATGQPIDGRTDLYSSGIVLYELLTGRVPFDSGAPIAVLHQHVYQPPPPPRSLNPNLPPALEGVLLRALAKDPDQRYQTAAEMAEALKQVSTQLNRLYTPSRLDRLYQDGVRAYSVGDWNRAVEKLAQLLAIVPEYEDAGDLLESAREAQSQTTNITKTLDQTMPDPHAGLVVQPARMPTLAALAAPPPIMAQALDPAPTYNPDPTPLDDQKTVGSVKRRWLWPALGAAAALLALMAVLGARARPLPGTQPTDTLLSAVAVAPATIQLNTAVATGAAIAPADSPTALEEPSAAPTPTPSAPPTPSATPTSSATATATTPPTPTPPPVPPADAVVNIPQLNLRRGPGQQYPNAGSYDQGTALKVIGRDPRGTWLRVTTPDGRSGWMFKEYLQVNIPLDGVPVIVLPTRTPAPRPTNPPPAPPTAPAPAPEPVPPTEEPAPQPLPPPTDTPEPSSSDPKPRPKPTTKPKPTEPP